ncbi:MAG: hypothetical protein ABI772_09605 [Bacteroidota bacterium]
MAGIHSKESIEITIGAELKLFIKSITASFSFIFYQNKYDFAKRVEMLELLDKTEVMQFAIRIEQAEVGSQLVLTRKEVYLFYTVMEVVCRSFLTEIADDFKAMALKLNKVTEERYNEVRNTELKIAQVLIQQIRKDFSNEPGFDDLLEEIEMLED